MALRSLASRRVLLFGGQGSLLKAPDCARDLLGDFPSIAGPLFSLADFHVKLFPLKAALTAPPERFKEIFQHTDKAQPAILLIECVQLRCLMETLGMEVAEFSSAALGHSLGEFAALEAAGLFSFQQALEITEVRGRAMKDSVLGRECGMSAVFTEDSLSFADFSSLANSAGLSPAAFNAPGQFAVAGDTAALEDFQRRSRLPGSKIRRVLNLAVRESFHSPAMMGAQGKLREKLNQSQLGQPRLEIFLNSTGEKLSSKHSLREELVKQLVEPVLFYPCVSALLNGGFTEFLEFGPSPVLGPLVQAAAKKIGKEKEIACYDLTNSRAIILFSKQFKEKEKQKQER